MRVPVPNPRVPELRREVQYLRIHPEYYCNNDNLNYSNCDAPAGARFYIHHNDFRDDGYARHIGAGLQNFGIGGIPTEYARIEYNRSMRQYPANYDLTTGQFRGSIDYFFKQGRCNGPLPKGNVTLLGNVLNGGTP